MADTDIDPNEDDGYYDDLDLGSDEIFELDAFSTSGADPDIGYDFEYFPGLDDAYEQEEDIREDSVDSLIFGDVGGGGYSVTDDTPDYPSGQQIAADDDKTKKDQKQKKEDEKNTQPKNTTQRANPRPLGPRTRFPGFPNTSIGVGTILTGGAALSISNSDDDETQVPVFMPDSPDGEPPRRPPPDPEEPQPNMATRLIPSTQTGTLPELSNFMPDYTPVATDIVGGMAGIAGVGLDAFARSQLGMTGDDPIAGFDIARETARQQTGALGEASGAGADASYTDMINAFADPLEGVGQMRDTFQDLQTLRQQEMARMDQGLSGRQRRDAIEAGRAKSDTRARDRLGDIDEIFSLVGADEGLRAQRMQNFFGAGELTADMATREAYALSPFTGAAVQAADLTPGLRLAGDISRQASAATPSPMELFGLEAGERQFGLDQEALDVAEKTGNLNVLGTLFGDYLNRPLNPNAGLGGDGQGSSNPFADYFLNQFGTQPYTRQFG
mgnify:CR=1 FL=1